MSFSYAATGSDPSAGGIGWFNFGDLTLSPGQTVTISFQVKVIAIPVPNPIVNVATTAFDFTLSPNNPDGATADSASNAVSTVVFLNNYSQQISDLVAAIALQEAALAAIANAAEAKIQKFVSMPDVTPDMLLCLNKSVTRMTDSITLLESILMLKLNLVDYQINSIN